MRLIKSVSDDISSDEDYSIIPSRDVIKRLAIIDGCNVIFHCSEMSHYSCDPKMPPVPKDQRKPEAIGLMLMVKYLLDEGYDVRIFISQSYTTGKQVNNCFILEQFHKLGILSVVARDQHDDRVILDLAAETGGFIISNDRFREFSSHKEAVNRVIRFKFYRIPLKKIGGKKAMQNYRNKYYFGMGLDLVLDPKICFSYIDKNYDFLLVHSQRRSHSKCRRFQTITRISVMADFLQREFCSVYSLDPPPYLPYFDETEPPTRFAIFFDNFCRWKNQQGNNIFVV